MKFCGIDLHSNNSVVVVTDETDRVLISRRCPNELTQILPLLEPHRGELFGVVVESTYNWYWLVDGLKAAGFEVKLANPVAMQRYNGLKHSDDKWKRGQIYLSFYNAEKFDGARSRLCPGWAVLYYQTIRTTLCNVVIIVRWCLRSPRIISAIWRIYVNSKRHSV
ncbi:IS110 family transposase [Pseudomonas sp. PP3]|uniref:IS110 family transposase n=1 Tax=Pseudomonas sp. PP3 TaxID=2815936 RepID=UPI001FD1A955|nr:IS110 family transposase [Pseudomonas sp. PP3]